jgi:hypothetical protein
MTAFDLAEYPSKATALISVAPHGFVGKERFPIPTFNHGNCVGDAIPPKTMESLPDGRTIRYENPSPTQMSQKHLLVISGGGPDRSIDLGQSGGCVSFSLDWKRMIVMDDWSGPDRPSSLTIYDFDKALAAGALQGAKVGTLPVQSATSAFFAGSSGDVVTTDLTNKVMRWSDDARRWSSREIYHGENAIVYAEPDATGDLIIVLEQLVGDTVVGALYSVKARQTWYDLGSDYKWLGAAFNTESNVAVTAHWKWIGSFPILPLSKLEALAEANLSPHCRPPTASDYHCSPCWP